LNWDQGFRPSPALMKSVSMPDACARLAIEAAVPPLDWLTYQIHIPSPSNAEGLGAGCGFVRGGGTVGAFFLASALAGRQASKANAAIDASRRAADISPSHRLRGELTGSR
jgi:hypothetical protein